PKFMILILSQIAEVDAVSVVRASIVAVPARTERLGKGNNLIVGEGATLNLSNGREGLLFVQLLDFDHAMSLTYGSDDIKSFFGLSQIMRLNFLVARKSGR